jgi:signal transduction histidine kinase
MSARIIQVNDEPCILSITRDITERKLAEVEREKLISELEIRNADLERFAYTISHDLKAPLVTINGFLSYLEEDATSGNMERLKNDIQRIQDAAKKMQRLLNELLELSRIGHIMNPSEEVQFEKIAHEVMRNAKGQLKRRGITIRLRPNLSTVYGDRQRLVEMLQNLVDNAAKFMGGQTDPQIEIGQCAEEDGKAVFYVRDNGIGIAPEYHERVFNLFERLDPKTAGTGVGLAIVKRIVEYQGGRIWVESEAGKGTTFYFTLPVSKTREKNDSEL